MSSATLIPVSEYLKTDYSPDCDYIDGELLERNVGEWEHAALQGILTAIFANHRKAWGVICPNNGCRSQLPIIASLTFASSKWTLLASRS